MFNYKGQSEEELKELCSDDLNKCPYQIIYWQAEVYSIGKCLRDITGYPQDKPLYIFTEHAPGNPQFDFIPDYELDNDAPVHFVSSKKTLDMFEKVSKKTCYQWVYPAITYKEKHNVRKKEDAKGTIVYPAHSIPGLKTEFDIDKFCNDLNNLPEEFKPICICLHYHDINNNQHLEFIKRGFPVYTAGNPYNPNYIDRFYDILTNFKYSMSNHFGSYAYYSVDLGIPFSIIGDEGFMENKEHEIYQKGTFKFTNINVFIKKQHELFSNKDRKVITDEQKDFIYRGLGLDSDLSTEQLRKILDDAYKSANKFKFIKKEKRDNKIKLTILGFIKISIKKKAKKA